MGIDLAWSEKNPSGVAVINSQGVVQKALASLRTNDEICQFAGLSASEQAVITIDAPLIVRNATGSRPVEQQLTQTFGLYNANPYPANLSNSAFHENGRIQLLVRYLEEHGFVNRPRIPRQQEQQSFLEVFPSPAQVMLFPTGNRREHLHGRALRYKHKKDREWLEVHSEWEIYRARLRSLGCRESAICPESSICREPTITFSTEVAKQIGIDITGYKGTGYKHFDDLLDGIFCAYLAYCFWYQGEDACWVIGGQAVGCVTLPRCPLGNCPHFRTAAP